MRFRLPILTAFLLLLVATVSAATTYTEQTNSIMFQSALGMLIPLGIENFVEATTAIMYYNYIAIGLIMMVAAFSGQANESRFTFFVPMFAALMYYIGWLQAPNQAAYWATLVGCILLGALIYINDMNREKYGVSGPGTKIISVAIMIIVFEASVVLMDDPAMNLFGITLSVSDKSQFCEGYTFSCDADGNVDLKASVSTVTNSGGTSLDVVSVATWAIAMVAAMLRFIILVLAAVFMFSAVIVARYPVLAASAPAMLILGIMQMVIWAVYMIAWFNWGLKPSYETAQV